MPTAFDQLWDQTGSFDSMWASSSQVDKVRDRITSLQEDNMAAVNYATQYWDSQFNAWQAQRQNKGKKFKEFMDTIPQDIHAQVTAELYTKWREQQAPIKALSEFAEKRQSLAFALADEYRKQNPKADTTEINRAVLQRLNDEGYNPTELGSLPPIAIDRNTPGYTPGWTEFVAWGRAAGKTLSFQIPIQAPMTLGTAIGEAITDFFDESTGAPVITGGNKYRAQRLWLDALDRRLTEYSALAQPKGGGFSTQVAAGLGQATGQLMVLGGGASAVRSAKLAGSALHANLAKLSTIGSIFAMEGSDAYQSYMRYAAEKGLDPRDASVDALGGAIAYASAATALEYFGPFKLLEDKIPGTKNRLIRLALTGSVEGGTEYIQRLSQDAIAYGIDLKDVTWENIQTTLQEAAMEGMIGALSGGVVGLSVTPATIAPVQMEPSGQTRPLAEVPTSQLRRQLITEPDITAHPALPAPEAGIGETVEQLVEPPVSPRETEAEIRPERMLPSPEMIQADYQATDQAARAIMDDFSAVSPDESLSGTNDSARQVFQELVDGTGAISREKTGNFLKGGIDQLVLDVRHIGEEAVAKTISMSESLKESSNSGWLPVEVYHVAAGRARRIVNNFQMMWNQAWKSIPRLRRGQILRWLEQYRPDGHTNWSTLIEHPNRFEEGEIPPEVLPIRDAYATTFNELGTMAVNAKIPMIQRVEIKPATEDTPAEYDWGVGVFKKISDWVTGGRYLRKFTEEGYTAFRVQSGPVFEAILDWLHEHPEANPDLPCEDRGALKEVLQTRQQLMAQKKIEGKEVRQDNSLSYSRVFTELPVAVPVNGQMISIMERNPHDHFRINAEAEAQEITLWENATDTLLPRYGQYNKETDQYEFPLGPRELGIVNVPGLIERMRMEVASGTRETTNRTLARFNRFVDMYHRIAGRGWLDEAFNDFGKGLPGKTISVVDNAIRTLVLQLAPTYDATNILLNFQPPLTASAAKAAVESVADIVNRRTKDTEAEYKAMGAIPDVYTSYALSRDSLGTDLLRRNVREGGMVLGRGSERISRYFTAKTHDIFLDTLNNMGKQGKPFSKSQLTWLRRMLRLTENDIGEISRGEMSEDVRSRAIQAAVNTMTGLTEFPMHRAEIETNPFGKFVVTFLGPLNARLRVSYQLTKQLASDIAKVKSPDTPLLTRREAALNAVSSAFNLLTWVAGSVGREFMQKYLRRSIKGQPIIDPNDPETWYGNLFETLATSDMFGLYARVFDAFRYSNNNLNNFLARLSFNYGYAIELANAIIGWGRYKDAPWGRRLQQLNLQYNPAFALIQRRLMNWTYPDREPYYDARREVRGWEKKTGQERDVVGRDIPKNWYYERIFEAIRDGDMDDFGNAVQSYKDWAREQGRTGEEARSLLRQSLMARSPVPLAQKRLNEFLSSLPDKKRQKIEDTLNTYTQRVDMLTRRPGVPPRPKKPQGTAPKPPGPDWYEYGY